MDIQATAKFVRISPKKALPLVRSLRGKKATVAVAGLKTHPTKTSLILQKLIYSAISNAKNNYNLKEDNLKIKRLTVDEGPRYKRYWFRSRGSADQLLKRASHFQVVLTEITPTLVKRKVEKKAVEASTKTTVTKATSAAPVDRNTKNVPRFSKVAHKPRAPRTTNK
ncbi:MAG: 50S ribosomal protein L22 [Patescibacteria group bacterium]|nr:50S ribosomal protein L22 [Patescibacteria group bacterium]